MNRITVIIVTVAVLISIGYIFLLPSLEISDAVKVKNFDYYYPRNFESDFGNLTEDFVLNKACIRYVSDSLSYSFENQMTDVSLIEEGDMAHINKYLRRFSPVFVSSTRVKSFKLATNESESRYTKVKSTHVYGANIRCNLTVEPNDFNPHGLNCKIGSPLIEPGEGIEFEYSIEKSGYVSVFLARYSSLEAWSFGKDKLTPGDYNFPMDSPSEFVFDDHTQKGRYIVVVATSKPLKLATDRVVRENNQYYFRTLFKQLRKNRDYSFFIIPVVKLSEFDLDSQYN